MGCTQKISGRLTFKTKEDYNKTISCLEFLKNLKNLTSFDNYQEQSNQFKNIGFKFTLLNASESNFNNQNDYIDAIEIIHDVVKEHTVIDVSDDPDLKGTYLIDIESEYYGSYTLAEDVQYLLFDLKALTLYADYRLEIDGETEKYYMHNV